MISILIVLATEGWILSDSFEEALIVARRHSGYRYPLKDVIKVLLGEKLVDEQDVVLSENILRNIFGPNHLSRRDPSMHYRVIKENHSICHIVVMNCIIMISLGKLFVCIEDYLGVDG